MLHGGLNQQKSQKWCLCTLISLINVGLQIIVGSGIFVTLYKQAFEYIQFFEFHPIYQWFFFSKTNKGRVAKNCVGPGIFSEKE